MPSKSIGKEEFEKLVSPLIGLEISHPWRSVGTAIFLELGSLTPNFHTRTGRRLNDSGEACIMIEWDWRVETRTEVAFGSSDSRGTIVRGIATLQGCRVNSITLVGRIPELRMEFSNGNWLRTMIMTGGDPQWSIRLPDGQWLGVAGGRVTLNCEAYEPTEEEKEAVATAEATVARWGIPRLEPAPGNCRDCRFFSYVSDFAILEYGCCTAPGSPFDGRAVHFRSGCPQFQRQLPLD